MLGFRGERGFSGRGYSPGLGFFGGGAAGCLRLSDRMMWEVVTIGRGRAKKAPRKKRPRIGDRLGPNGPSSLSVAAASEFRVGLPVPGTIVVDSGRAEKVKQNHPIQENSY